MNVVVLGEVAEINPKGPGRNEISPDELLDFVPMADVQEDGRMRSENRRPYLEVAKGFTAFRDRDVLLAKITPCFENNKIALAKVSTPYAFGSTEFHVIRGKPEKLHPEYIAHFLRQDCVRYAGERRMTGSAGQRRVPKAFLEELEIPLPPLDEQKRIAAILDQADALRRLRQRAIDRLNTLGQAIFHEMFGDFDTASHLVQLGDCTSKIGSGATPKGGSEAYKSKGIPLVKSMNVRDGSFEAKGLAFIDDTQAGKLDNVVVEENDVLLNITGASVARVCRAPASVSSGRVNQHVAIIRPNQGLMPEFLEEFLLLPKTKRKLLTIAEAGATRQDITKSQIEKLEIPIPPKSIQANFVREKSQAVGLIETANFHLKRCEALFTSLQHRAFRGEL